MVLNDPAKLASLLEAILLAYNQPLTLDQILSLFEEEERPSKKELQASLQLLEESCQERSFELKEVATGYRLQVRTEFTPWVSRLWEEKPQRYSRALLETLALIAYRQPITRGEIEDIRGVTVSSQIIKTLQEREWIRVVGYKDVPGKPAMLATTREFLDYFNLKSLDELPALSSIKPIDSELSLIEEELMLTIQENNMTEEEITAEPADQEESFKSLLDEWSQLEKGLKTDFDDIIENVATEPEPEPEPEPES